jgi:hypothetical protein
MRSSGQAKAASLKRLRERVVMFFHRRSDVGPLHRFASALVILSALTTGVARAEDNLSRMLAALPDESMRDVVTFSYLAPNGGFGDYTSLRHHSVTSKIVSELILSSGPSLNKTGFDILEAESVLQAGHPPDEFLVFGGPKQMTANMPSALAPRQFAETDILGTRVFSKGEDFQISFQDFDREDPFGAGVGKSQRLAMLDNMMVYAAGHSKMRRVLEGLTRADTCKTCKPWRLLVSAVMERPAKEERIVQAIGFSGVPFLGRLDQTAGNSSYTLLAVRSGAGPATLWIVDGFTDAASARNRAEKASQVLSQKLAGQLSDKSLDIAGVTSTSFDTSAGSISIVFVNFDDETKALDAMRSISGLVLNKDF